MSWLVAGTKNEGSYRSNPHMALSKLERLRKTRDIERVFRRSQRIDTELITLRMHKKSNLPGRLAIVISKAVAKKAVQRTLLRRRISEWMRKAHIGLYAADFVISVKPHAAEVTKKMLYQDLAGVLHSLQYR